MNGDGMGRRGASSSATAALAAAGLILAFGACSHGSRAARVSGSGSGRQELTPRPGATQVGEASYYASTLDGRSTASGERYREARLTCAHRTLPFGVPVRVTNLENGRSVVVVVNDRGPFVSGRIVDLSRAAATRIGLLTRGVAPVRLEVLPCSAAVVGASRLPCPGRVLDSADR